MKKQRLIIWILFRSILISSLFIFNGCKDKEEKPDSWYIEGEYLGGLEYTKGHDDWFSVGSEAIVSKMDSIYTLTMNVRDSLPVLVHIPVLHLKITRNDFPMYYFEVLDNPYFKDTGNEWAKNYFYTEEGSDYKYSAISLDLISLDPDSVYYIKYTGTRWY